VPLRRPILPRVMSIFFWADAALRVVDAPVEKTGRSAQISSGTAMPANNVRTRMRAARVVVSAILGCTMAGNDFTVLHLDETDAIPVGEHAGDWIPLRHLLDVRAFGINVWIARKAGDQAVERHDEIESDPTHPGQEELYVLLRGAARFTVGGESFDTRAGSVVFIRDPALLREAVALEDDTATLSIGGRRGAFEVSEWEGRWLRSTQARE